MRALHEQFPRLERTAHGEHGRDREQQGNGKHAETQCGPQICARATRSDTRTDDEDHHAQCGQHERARTHSEIAEPCLDTVS